jgi:hypothetical protein
MVLKRRGKNPIVEQRVWGETAPAMWVAPVEGAVEEAVGTLVGAAGVAVGTLVGAAGVVVGTLVVVALAAGTSVGAVVAEI